MAKVSVSVDDAAEQATLEEARARFGSDVVDVLVTNWIRGHAERFETERNEAITAAAKIDPTFAQKLDALHTEGAQILDAKAADDAKAAEADRLAAEEAAKK